MSRGWNSGPGTGRHIPALDGVRALSIVLVLCYHAGAGWASGGYIGVSVFFTLSGFLITRLLLDEIDATGRVDRRRFWIRRLRRLMPASLICVAGVIALRLVGAFGDVTELRPDVLGALTHTANWVQLAQESSYAEQIAGAESPLVHFWSLAIEEQFYWTWPLVLPLLAALPSRRVALAGATAVAALSAPITAVLFGGDAAYWATPARIAEILIGALLADVVRHRRRPHAVAAEWSGLAGLAGIAAITIWWPASGGPATEGWLPVAAIASALLIVGAIADSRISRALSSRPLVVVGRWSYGIYLYHWPIFLVVDEQWERSPSTLVLQLAITLGVAAASYELVERPIREGRPVIARDVAIAGVATATLLVVTVVAPLAEPAGFETELSLGFAASPASVPPTATPATRPVAPEPSPVDTTSDTTGDPASDPTSDTASDPTLDPTADTTGEPASDDVADPVIAGLANIGDETFLASLPTEPPARERTVRILVAGDSVAWTISVGLQAWAEQYPGRIEVAHEVAPSCGFIGDAALPGLDRFEDGCDDLIDTRLPAVIAEHRPDLVVLFVTRADVWPRVWSADEGELDATDPRYRRRRTDAYVAATSSLLELGAGHVVWLTPPTARPLDDDLEPMMLPDATAALTQSIRDTVADAGGRATVVDLAGWYAVSGLDDDESRSDGVHFGEASTLEIATRLLAPALLYIADSTSAGTGQASQRSPS